MLIYKYVRLLFTTTASGKLVFGIFAALAEFERELIRERTMAGLAAARARGRKPRLPGLTILRTSTILDTYPDGAENSEVFLYVYCILFPFFCRPRLLHFGYHSPGQESARRAEPCIEHVRAPPGENPRAPGLYS